MLALTDLIVIIIIIAIIIIIFKILQVISSLLTDYSAGENIMSKGVWAFISRLLTYLLIIIIVTITVLWIMWRLLKLISPIILGFGDLIIKIIPPFPQLEETGIFQLWDDLFYSIIQFSPTGVFRAFAKFFNNFGEYIAKKGGDSKKDKKKTNDKKQNKGDTSEYVVVSNKTENTDEADKADKTQQEDEPDDTNGEQTDNTNPDATEESKYTAEEHKAVQTKVDMCIAENSTPTDSSTDMIEKLKASVNNNKVSLMCQAQSLGQYNAISNYK